MKFRTGSLFALIFVIAVILWCGISMRAFTGKSLSRDQFQFDVLPDDAADIDYYFSGFRNPDNYYEFATGESGFAEWVENVAHERQISFEKKVGPIAIYRYDVDQQTRTTLNISNGIEFMWVDPKRGDHYLVLSYDQDERRAYYYKSNY